MDISKVCKHKSHQKTNTNSQKSKQSESRRVFIQFFAHSIFSMFLLFSNVFFIFSQARSNQKTLGSVLNQTTTSIQVKVAIFW